MRKYGIILIVCLVIGTIGSGIAMSELGKLERVPVEGTWRAGTASVAAGLEISFDEYLVYYDKDYNHKDSAQVRRNLITFDDNGAHTSVEVRSFGEKVHSEHSAWEEKYDDIDARYLYASVSATNMDLRNLLSRDLQLELQKSREKKTIKISELTEYYPWVFSLSIPHISERNGKIDNRYYNERDYEETRQYQERNWESRSDREYQILKTLQDKFRIPVNPEQEITIYYEPVVYAEDSKYNFWVETRDHDEYDPYFYTVASDSVAYFTFTTHTEMGKVIDTSQIAVEGGYGIYALPYDRGTDGTDDDVKIEDLRLFYPLNPETEVKDISLTLDQKTLLVIYTLEDEYFASLIDVQTANCLLNVSLDYKPSVTSTITYPCIVPGDNYFAVSVVDISTVDWGYSWEERKERRNREGRLVVLGCDGEASVLMKGHGSLEEVGKYNRNTHVAFDGRRLAVMTTDRETPLVSVYSEEGLVYYIEFESPLRKAASETSYLISSLEYEASLDVSAIYHYGNTSMGWK